MTPKLMDRLAKLEAQVVVATGAKSLTFQVEAPPGVSTEEIVAFLKECGHAIHAEDEVFVMNLGACGMAEGASILDLSPELLTEEARAAAPAGGKWPKGLGTFTFVLDSPRVLQ